jgi:hypothetical protein
MTSKEKITIVKKIKKELLVNINGLRFYVKRFLVKKIKVEIA